MNLMKPLAALGLAFTVGACATAENVDTLNQTEATGSAFTMALAQEYRAFAQFERDEMYDWRDATYFADKGLRAANGEVVVPEQLADWNLPGDMVDELSSARAELVGALDGNARSNHPELAGHAQGRFDCWVEQQEENHQPEDIAACREAYYKAMSELQEAMTAEQQQAPEPEEETMAPERFRVLFGFDRDGIRQDQRPAIREAVQVAREMDDVRFSVTGHADTAGPADYNRDLSLRRAQNVRDALVERGVDADRISVAARGESEPAVQTGDGVREQRNRRAVISVQ